MDGFVGVGFWLGEKYLLSPIIELGSIVEYDFPEDGLERSLGSASLRTICGRGGMLRI